MSHPLIVVLGATGAQGGSVVNYLLKSGKYRVRGTTRDVNSAKAKELKDKGVEVVVADNSNKEQLREAFKGAYGVYSVTNFWDPEVLKNPELEKVQGRLIADVAKESGVQHFIYSSLHDAKTISKGKLELPHFSGKNEVEQYVKTLGFPYTTFFYAGCYMSNFFGFFKVNVRPDGVAELSLPVHETARLPLLDIEDTGIFVLAAFENRDKYNGKKILGASEYITLPQFAATYTKVTGKPFEYKRVSFESLKPFVPDELIQTFEWFNHGYFNNEDISENKTLYPNLATWEQYLKRTGKVFA
jgi:uncharacterized protein YbjT (DUF2867 family)